MVGDALAADDVDIPVLSHDMWRTGESKTLILSAQHAAHAVG
jgi:hypothetical protein